MHGKKFPKAISFHTVFVGVVVLSRIFVVIENVSLVNAFIASVARSVVRSVGVVVLW